MPQPTHSPAFIAEMKNKLQDEKNKLQEALDAIGSKHGNDYQADFPDYGRSEEDNATEMGDYANASATERTLEDELHGTQEALERIEAGTYGITAAGDLIPEARLRANPAATTIIKWQSHLSSRATMRGIYYRFFTCNLA